MILIFIESSIPMDGGSHNITFLTELDPGLQNFLHIPLYGLLAFLWMRALAVIGIQPFASLIIALMISILFGCLDEFHQSFVPGRFGGLIDIYLNCIGSLLGVFIFKYFYSNV
jgi:VanZ family protein